MVGVRGRCECGREASNSYLAGFVLCDFMLGMLLAALALAVGATSLGNVDL